MSVSTATVDPGPLRASEWVRRRYYVDGGYLRPIPSSQVERYNPFNPCGGTGGSPRTLYLDLVNLNEADDQAIARFTSKWGLLGLFQDQLVQLRYRLNREGDLLPKVASDFSWVEVVEGPDLAVTVPWVQWEYHCWIMRMSPRDADDEQYWRFRAAVERELQRRGVARWLDACDEGATATIYSSIPVRHGDIARGEFAVGTGVPVLRDVPLREYVGRYMPDLMRNAPPAPPGKLTDLTPYLEARLEEVRRINDAFERGELTEADVPRHTPEEVARIVEGWMEMARRQKADRSLDTWDHLCEPVGEFRSATQEFKKCYDLLTRATRGMPTPEQLAEVKLYLEPRIRRVYPVLLPSSKSPDGLPYEVPGDAKRKEVQAALVGMQRGWAFPSLIAACYMMLYLDFTDGRRFRLCANRKCRLAFVPKRPNQYYHDDSCLKAQSQRESRARKASAAEAASQHGACPASSTEQTPSPAGRERPRRERN